MEERGGGGGKERCNAARVGLQWVVERRKSREVMGVKRGKSRGIGGGGGCGVKGRKISPLLLQRGKISALLLQRLLLRGRPMQE